MAKDVRIDIGFDGGGATNVSTPHDHVVGLRTALEGDRSEWHSLPSSDGAVFLVDLSRIVYVRISAEDRSVGFGSV